MTLSFPSLRSSDLAEVVLEVARADLQLVGDVVGGDRRLALRVEHRKRAVEDALAGVAGHRGWAGQPASFFTRSTYFCFASSWPVRSEEHTSELQSLMRISYAVFCLKKKNKYNQHM